MRSYLTHSKWQKLGQRSHCLEVKASLYWVWIFHVHVDLFQGALHCQISVLAVRGKGWGHNYLFNKSLSLAQEHTPAFIRKGNSSPGTGTHQKPGARRGCLLYSKMLLITSSLGSIFAVLRGAQELLTLISQCLWETATLWVSAVLLAEFGTCCLSFFTFHSMYASLLGVCWTKCRSARVEAAGVSGSDLP